MSSRLDERDEPGAWCSYNGVTIGSVSNVYITHNQAPNDQACGVIQIDQSTADEDGPMIDSTVKKS